MRGTNALGAVIKYPAACPWDPCVRNKDVEVPAKLLHNQVDVLRNVGLVRDVDFIRLACARRRASARLRGRRMRGHRKKKKKNSPDSTHK